MASNTKPAQSELQEEPQIEENLPAYNANTGTLDVREAGFDAQTQARTDGRVDISINETDARLAAQLQKISLPDYQQSPDLVLSPDSLGLDAHHGLPDDTPPPPLNIVIQVVGSRGDVQPFVALGRELKNKYGHRIRLATHATFMKFVEENGLEFFEIGGDPSELMAFMVKNPGLIPGIDSLKAGDVGKRRKGIAEILQGCWKSCADADEVQREGEAEGENGDVATEGATKVKPFVAHAIIANPPSFAHIHCAEKLGIPLHIMFTMPWSPTRDFPHPIANIKASNADGSLTNEMSYTLVEMMTWQGLGDIINKFRSETLHLGILSQGAATTALERLRIPHTYCWSPALIPKPKDWGPHISISGFFFLSLASNYQPDPELAAFLAAGPPPVYIGFGSIVVDDPNAMTKLIFDAVALTGHRALVSKGWGGLGGDALLATKPSNIFMLGNVPHDWLFQHVSAVVHHGGAGTMSAGISLGRPTVIVPFFGDQPFWGAMVARAGAGPAPIPYKDLTAASLSAAILSALTPQTLERAQELGALIRAEDGCAAAARFFHAQLNIPKLRCRISPSRPAVWHVKNAKHSTQDDDGDMHLSAFAATVLGDAGVLDVNTLEPYRPREHWVQEHFLVSNARGSNPILGTLGSLASGIARWPVNVGKAYAGVIYQPYKGARRDGWRGFGKGIGKGVGGVLFPKKGLVINGRAYGVRAAYNAVRKHFGAGTLSYILATNFALGFEEARLASEEERKEVLTRWHEVQAEAEIKRQQRSSTGGSAFSRLRHSSTRGTGESLSSSTTTSLSQQSTVVGSPVAGGKSGSIEGEHKG